MPPPRSSRSFVCHAHPRTSNQVFLVRKNRGTNKNKVYAMKVLKKASIVQNKKVRAFVVVVFEVLLVVLTIVVAAWLGSL